MEGGEKRGREGGRKRVRLDSMRGEEGAGESAETAKKNCFCSDVQCDYRGLLISKLCGHPTETHLHFVLQQLNQYSAHGLEGKKMHIAMRQNVKRIYL